MRFFHKFYMILFHKLQTFTLSSFLPSITSMNCASSYRKMLRGPMNNARDYHEYRHKWGKIGPSYLFYEDGGLSFYCIFRNNSWLGTFTESLKEKFISNFYFWGITLSMACNSSFLLLQNQPKNNKKGTSRMFYANNIFPSIISVISYLSIYHTSE